MTDKLRAHAVSVRSRAYAPYSNFQVGAALEDEAGQVHVGCNVENVAYPEGTCAEAGAIAAMIAQGGKTIRAIYVVADSPSPVPPCGGCRQKIAEFAREDTEVILATVAGAERRWRVGDLLPGAFAATHMDPT